MTERKALIWERLGFSFLITDRTMVAIEARQLKIAKLEKLEKQLAKHRKDYPIFCDLDTDPNREFMKLSRQRASLVNLIMGLRKELRLKND